MDSRKALAILALSLSINAAALPQKELPIAAVSAPKIALGSTTQVGSIQRRQLLGLSLPLPAATSSTPAVAVSSVLSTPSAVANPLGGLSGALGNLPVVGSTLGGVTGGSSNPLGAVTGATGSVPVVGSALGGVTGGSSNPLGAVTGAVGSVPVVGSALGGVTGAVSNPLGAAAGTVASVASSPLGAVGGLANTAAGAATGAVSGLPVVGGLAAGALSPYPVNSGIPGTDPIGSFSISVIATLLSLLKKDPLSLFAPSLPIPSLVKRDLPNIHRAGIPELAKRQLPSLSSGVSGIGVGGLTGSGVPGVPPDLAFLVGSIAKNIAVPGGTGLGAITGNILSVLNGVVPNFLFQLPVVQDSVPTFGVLQLLASINPTKFGQLGTLNSLPALSLAASALPAGDLNFLKTLPISSDPTNLVTTIMSFSDNLLSLPGNVANLKAAVAALSLKSLGLAVPGL